MGVRHGLGRAGDAGQGRDVDELVERTVARDLLPQLLVGPDAGGDPHVVARGDRDLHEVRIHPHGRIARRRRLGGLGSGQGLRLLLAVLAAHTSKITSACKPPSRSSTAKPWNVAALTRAGGSSTATPRALAFRWVSETAEKSKSTATHRSTSARKMISFSQSTSRASRSTEETSMARASPEGSAARPRSSRAPSARPDSARRPARESAHTWSCTSAVWSTQRCQGALMGESYHREEQNTDEHGLTRTNKDGKSQASASVPVRACPCQSVLVRVNPCSRSLQPPPPPDHRRRPQQRRGHQVHHRRARPHRGGQGSEVVHAGDVLHGTEVPEEQVDHLE